MDVVSSRTKLFVCWLFCWCCLPFVDDILRIVILVVTNVVTSHPIESDPSTSHDSDRLSHVFHDLLVLHVPPWFWNIVMRFCVRRLVNVSIVRHDGSCLRLAPCEHVPRVVTMVRVMMMVAMEVL